MKIAILGAGAIGSLFGALLWESGEDVVLIGRKRHVDAIRSRGLKVSGISGERIVKPKAVTTTQEVGKVDLIIISVKSYDTKQAAKEALNMIHHNTVVLTIQNGLGNIEKLCEIIGEKHVVGGVTMQGSTLVKPGEIYHAGKGPTIIGELNGEITNRIKRIAETFNKAKIETQITQNIWGVLWDKLIINVGINALTAITRMKNGELLKIPEIRDIMIEAVKEAVNVAKALNIKLEIKDHVRKVIEVAEATANNKSSMLQDIEKGKRTEIDYINGAIVKLGKKLKIKTPVNKTLTAIVKAIFQFPLPASDC